MVRDERFLVTGALGCIGAWVIRRLVREGVPVVGYDAATDTRRLRLLLDEAQRASVPLVHGDIAQPGSIEQVIDAHRITHVIHLAALLHPQFRADPVRGVRVNALGGVQLFEAVAQRRESVCSIVYASSIAVYDGTDFGDSERVGHDSVGRPATLYGVFKQAEEAMARVYFNDRGVSSIGLRPATVFGAGRDQGLSAAPTEAILAAARGRPFHIPYGGRSHLHYADDVARIFIACARADYRGAEVFNMRGTTADMAQIVGAIESVAPDARGSISFDPGPTLPLPTDYDDSALARIIGTPPCTLLQDAAGQTLALFRAAIARGEMSDA